MLDEAIARLRPGDIVGHANSGHQGSLIRKDGSVHPRARELAGRGLLLEVGYGLTTTFAATRALFEAGISLDICSSDAHGITLGRPRATTDFANALSYTMTGTMTKMWALGMPLVEVIRASTVTPARVLGLERTKGTLSRDVPADLTILEAAGGQWELTDNAGERLRVPEVLVPTHTIKGGHVHELRAMEMVEFQQEYVRAGLRVPGVAPARRLEHCSRIASGQWWNDPRARQGQGQGARAAGDREKDS
jgi:dihydroorotase